MSDSFFLGLLIFLQVSVFVHILFIVSYISEKSGRSFRGFLVTTFTNFFIGMIMMIVLIRKPDIIGRLKLEPMLLLESGLMFCFLMFVKIRITIKIIKRSRDPENFDINYFGKKVYRTSIVKKGELAAYYLTMPFTLIAGAYFIVNVVL